MIGMLRTFGGARQTPEGSATTSWLAFILVPYTAMGISMLLVLLLLLLRRLASVTGNAPYQIQPLPPNGYSESGTHDRDSEHPQIIGERKAPWPKDYKSQ